MLRGVSSSLSLLAKSSWWRVALSVSVGDDDWLFGCLVPPAFPSPAMTSKQIVVYTQWSIKNANKTTLGL